MAGRILVVEDDLITREGLAVVLGQEGYAVRTAADADEALGLLRQPPPVDLILLDMVMPPPAGDGWRFLAQRQREPALADIPVVIATGLGIATAEWAASLGAAGFVKKPFDLEALLAEIRRCLPGSAA